MSYSERNTTGHDHMSTVLYRTSPYEHPVTTEPIAQVFVCGEAVTTQSGDVHLRHDSQEHAQVVFSVVRLGEKVTL